MSILLPIGYRQAIRAPSVVPPSTWFANEPTSAGWVTVRDMNMGTLPYRLNYEADNGSGMYYYNPDDIARVTARTDATTEPVSSPTALRTTLPAGWTGGGGSMSRWETRNFPSNTGYLYLAYTLRPSSNWYHPGFDTGWKNWYLRPAGGDSDSIHFFAWVDTTDSGPGTMLPKFGTQWGGALTDEAWYHRTYANRIIPGVWNIVEFLITPNSGGAYNGTLDVWVNGTACPVTNVSHGTSINWFRAGQTVGWNGVWWDMIYANPSAIPPAEQYLEHGHVLIKVK